MGRPKGSKNKPKVVEPEIKRGPGRPRKDAAEAAPAKKAKAKKTAKPAKKVRAKTEEDPQLLVVSKTKEAIKALGLRCGADFVDALNHKIAVEIRKAAKRAAGNSRSTLKEIDAI